ncbi:NAD-dependent epimerase/dehydratase family protein [Gracilibacillus sp. HCP3S3_G5_1]|uniref:NAD-dependent epimerase/dehydratase family protein n=1 Tax=unclassified Gracilibacillus TaxID=2625209 RepID=UPI003F897201
MTILITGGSGFVGINIIERLLNAKLDVINYATFPIPSEANSILEECAGTYTYIEGDVLDSDLLDRVMKQYDINMVIHGAVITPDFEREQIHSKYIANVNYMGTMEVLEAARKHDVEKFLYISSVSVYGDTAFEDKILNESQSIPMPRSLYEITKFAAERTVLRYKELHDINVIVTRLGQVFGPWERYTGIRHTLSGPFQATRLALLNKRVNLSRPGLRDWVYSKDVANAMLDIIQKDNTVHPIYNIGSGQQWTIAQWCELLMQELPSFQYKIGDELDDFNIDFFVPEDASMLSIARLQKDVGYNPRYGMKEAFHDYMNWINNNSDFWLHQQEPTKSN